MIVLLGIFTACGCSRHDSEVMAAPYADEALYNYQTGKYYLADGRYELAKESFTLALAASRNPEMRLALMRELDSVNMMIQTLR